MRDVEEVKWQVELNNVEEDEDDSQVFLYGKRLRYCLVPLLTKCRNLVYSVSK